MERAVEVTRYSPCAQEVTVVGRGGLRQTVGAVTGVMRSPSTSGNMGRTVISARVTGERDQQGPQRGGLSTFFKMGKIAGVEMGVRTSTHSQEAEPGLVLRPSLSKIAPPPSPLLRS